MNKKLLKKIGKGITFFAVFGVTGVAVIGIHKLYKRYKSRNQILDVD